MGLLPDRFVDLYQLAKVNGLCRHTSSELRLLLPDPGAKHGYSGVVFYLPYLQRSATTQHYAFPHVGSGVVICDMEPPPEWLEWFALQRAETPGISALQSLAHFAEMANTWGQLHRLWPDMHLLLRGEIAAKWPKNTTRVSPWPKDQLFRARLGAVNMHRLRTLASAAAAKYVLFSNSDALPPAVTTETHPIQYLPKTTAEAGDRVAEVADMVSA
jgi:hypothetical protein